MCRVFWDTQLGVEVPKCTPSADPVHKLYYPPRLIMERICLCLAGSRTLFYSKLTVTAVANRSFQVTAVPSESNKRPKVGSVLVQRRRRWPSIEPTLVKRFLFGGFDCALERQTAVSEWILVYFAFCTIMAISRQNEARSRDYALLLSDDFKVIAQSTIDSNVNSRSLNSSEHCICTTPMINIRPGRDSNPVHLSFEPQPDRMSHRAGLKHQ